MEKKLTPTQRMKNKLMEEKSGFAEAYEEARLESRLTIGLRKQREALGLTQVQVSERTGIKQAEISKIESGNANPTIATIAKLATILGIKLFWAEDENNEIAHNIIA